MQEKRLIANHISQLNTEVCSLESLLECLINDEVIKSIHVERRTEVHEKRSIQHLFELDDSEVKHLSKIIQEKIAAKIKELENSING